MREADHIPVPDRRQGPIVSGATVALSPRFVAPRLICPDRGANILPARGGAIHVL